MPRSTRIKEYASPRRKRLLVVEDNPAEQLSIQELLGYDDIDVDVVDYRRRSARCAVRKQAIRLRGARPAAAGYVRLRSSGAAARHAVARATCRWSSSPGKELIAGRRCAAAHAGAQRGGQGCGIAGAAAGRDRAVPASRGRRPSAGEAEDARPAASLRRCAGRQARCWSWTTTCATSSRSAACWSAAA